MPGARLELARLFGPVDFEDINPYLITHGYYKNYNKFKSNKIPYIPQYPMKTG